MLCVCVRVCVCVYCVLGAREACKVGLERPHTEEAHTSRVHEPVQQVSAVHVSMLIP